MMDNSRNFSRNFTAGQRYIYINKKWFIKYLKINKKNCIKLIIFF